ncbi:MAG: glycosyltransferase family 4 protein [Bacilli bacterium]|nr:glycosyltransferase family 4 protein [Bacilli bacterium]
MRIFWLFNHPAPYKVDFFNCLGENNELTVYFERLSEGGRNATFYGHAPKTFHAIYGHPLKLGSFNNLSWKPLSYIKKKEFDVIVLNGWRTFTERIAISYCKRHHIPYVFAINGGIIRKKENNISSLIKSSYISGADLYLSPDECSSEYLTYYGADKARIRLFPYGSVKESELLDQLYDEKAIAKLRKKLDIPGRRVFVSSGFFIPRKGFESLIRLWERMPKEDSLYLIGEGKQKRLYQRLIRELGLTNVFIRPFMDHANLFRFYRACDAFLFPTKEDIYGHVVTEAMSQGLPVFSSDKANASKRLIKPKINGSIVDFDNAEEVVLTLCNADLPSMKQKAIETAKGYTYEASAKAHQELLEEFLKGGAKP